MPLSEGGATEMRGTNSPYTDRKSTRLNSSHANISYAVFCLKKKNNFYYPNKLATENTEYKVALEIIDSPFRKSYHSGCTLHCASTAIFFFFNDTATTEIYTLSLHDALPIYAAQVTGLVERTASALGGIDIL